MTVATTVVPSVGAFESRLSRSPVAFMRARLPASNGAVLGWKDGAVLHLDVVGDRSFVGGVLGSEHVDGLHDHLRVGRQRSGHWISTAVVVGGSGWSLNATVTARTYSGGCAASTVR